MGVSLKTNSKKFGLNATELKYIAILAMLIDHIAYMFVPSDTVLYQCMRCIGRTTAPIMCFFISEGYHYTRNIKKYFLRLGIFAVISHFAFTFCFDGSFFVFRRDSVITTLFLSLLSLFIYNSEKVEKAFRLPLLLLILAVADFCDWGANAVLFTFAFEFARDNDKGDRRKAVLAYAMVAFTRKMLPILYHSIGDIEILKNNWQIFGLFIPALLLLLYNGEKGGGKYTKWVFYVFYPAHLLLLGYIEWKITH